MSESGLILPGAPAPVEGEDREYLLDPKDTGAYKEAIANVMKAQQEASEYGVAFLTFLADGIKAAENLREADKERARVEKRMVKASGIHESQITGLDLDRGVLKYKKGK